jgi:hypothetical protein
VEKMYRTSRNEREKEKRQKTGNNEEDGNTIRFFMAQNSRI